MLNTYPELIRAAEAPVIDTSCAALLLLAREVHARGFKVALTGEGADEWLAGYPWHKINRAPGLPRRAAACRCRSGCARASSGSAAPPRFPWANVRQSQQAVGGHNGWLDLYGLMSMSKLRFFSPGMQGASARPCAL